MLDEFQRYVDGEVLRPPAMNDECVLWLYSESVVRSMRGDVLMAHVAAASMPQTPTAYRLLCDTLLRKLAEEEAPAFGSEVMLAIASCLVVLPTRWWPVAVAQKLHDSVLIPSRSLTRAECTFVSLAAATFPFDVHRRACVQTFVLARGAPLSDEERSLMLQLALHHELVSNVYFATHNGIALVARWLADVKYSMLHVPQELRVDASVVNVVFQRLLSRRQTFQLFCECEHFIRAMFSLLVTHPMPKLRKDDFDWTAPLAHRCGTLLIVRAMRELSTAHAEALFSAFVTRNEWTQDDRDRFVALWPSKLGHHGRGHGPDEEEEKKDPRPARGVHECPITLERCEDPVFASDGHTYERDAILKHMLVDVRSPMTRAPLHGHLVDRQV